MDTQQAVETKPLVIVLGQQPIFQNDKRKEGWKLLVHDESTPVNGQTLRFEKVVLDDQKVKREETPIFPRMWKGRHYLVYDGIGFEEEDVGKILVLLADEMGKIANLHHAEKLMLQGVPTELQEFDLCFLGTMFEYNGSRHIAVIHFHKGGNGYQDDPKWELRFDCPEDMMKQPNTLVAYVCE